VHYERKCDIIAPCCRRPYGCRICHDEMSLACGTMDRFAISAIVCRRCKRVQCSKTNECESCRTPFAEYHCAECNLWMSTDKEPFHCDLCGICRVGGRENYRHCDTCCMCVSASVYDTHGCEYAVCLSVLAAAGPRLVRRVPPMLYANAMGYYFKFTFRFPLTRRPVSLLPP
jgi:RING finger/CHY zinc finger protein 1